ncbi:hypothetical protein MMC29_007620 [Sticta canariensis]|nr:hypothetical protein [Sticta canariensis]
MPKLKSGALLSNNPSKSKAAPSLSNLIDSGMEEDGRDSNMDPLPTPDSNQENPKPTEKERKPPGRPKAVVSKNTRAKTSRRRSGVPVAAKTKGRPRKKVTVQRTALQEQASDRHQSDDESMGDAAEKEQDGLKSEEDAVSMDELVTKDQPRKRGKQVPKAKRKPEEEPRQQVNVTENDGEFEYTPTVVRTQSKKAGMAAKQTGGHNPSIEPQHAQKIVPETQQRPMDLDESAFPEDGDAEDVVPQSVFRQSSNQGSNSRQRQPFLTRRRAGSASDTDRAAGDPATRRRIGELTKKLENVDIKYRNLREIGLKEAEANFEKLKEQSESRANAANGLIISLKKELATQTAIAQESRSLQKQLGTSDAALSAAQQHVNELSTSLSEAQNEINALQIKLANSRGASVAVESVNAKTPGSAMRGKGQLRTIMVGSAEAAQAAQVALLKEDLYSDLTGLILRGVERGDESDVYDCIQTGRNGTLHFKLAVANDNDAKIHYEDATFLYTPRFDTNRDRDLLELLPDYLSEEIVFSRVNAAKFYGRVVETLTKKRTEDDLRQR